MGRTVFVRNDCQIVSLWRNSEQSGLEDWRTGGVWSRSLSRQPPWSPEWWWQWWFLLRTTSIESRKWTYPYIPNHNSKCNCFSDLYQSTLTRQNIPSVQLIISGVVVDWSLSGVIVHILLAISIPYLTKEQLKLGNYICYEILTYKLSKL